MSLNTNQLLVILGPTATGKTDLALQLARKFQGELVSVDSRQVYKGLDIGTGKLSGSGRWEVRRGNKKWEVGGIGIWMYDVISYKMQYTVANYVKDADRIIEDVRQRGKLPILVGGTGLYMKALLDGLSNLAVSFDKKVRKQLEKLSLNQLQEKLQLVSLQRWEKMNRSDRANPRRLIRAIELSTLPRVGRSFTRLRRVQDDVLKIGLNAPRKDLYQRADKRVVDRINQGMIEEARRLHRNELSLKRMRQLGLEYGVLADYLASKIKTREDLIKIMQGRIHGYIRRQLTWFKKEKNIFWFDITSKDCLNRIEELINKWYYNEIKGGDYAAKN